MTDTAPFLRIFSRRAPYTRGGVKFSTTREPVEFRGDDIPSPDRLARLVADTHIRIEVHDPATGQMFVAASVNDQGALTAPAEPEAPADVEASAPPARPRSRGKATD